jgi:hypothetical protein
MKTQVLQIIPIKHYTTQFKQNIIRALGSTYHITSNCVRKGISEHPEHPWSMKGTPRTHLTWRDKCVKNNQTLELTIVSCRVKDSKEIV